MKPHFSPYVVAGDLVFLSGQLGFGPGGALAEGGIEGQTRATLANVEAVLKTIGLGLGDIVKATVFITRSEDFALFNQTYADVFGDHKPARSTVVTGLAVPGAVVEIEAIAKLR
jgi:2-iminobutanoate/2-iminopropanoate deaminase